MRFLIRAEDTRKNGEDFALTPFITIVWPSYLHIKSYGIGFNWGWKNITFLIGFHIPKSIPFFKYETHTN